MTGEAIGYGTQVSQTLGYLKTTTTLAVPSAAVVVKSALDRAKGIWDSYLRDSGSDVNTPFLATGYPPRATDAAYYYAVEMIAEEFIRLRSGNAALQKDSPISQLIISKAQALMAIAKAGIEEYEKYCATESAVYGADYIELLAGALSLQDFAISGADIAAAEWGSAAADFIELDSTTTAYVPGLPTQLQAGAYGYTLLSFGAHLQQKRLGFSGARNPGIAQYWATSASNMVAAGTELVAKFEAWVKTTKIQAAVGVAGL